ncbi:MAG TPA: XRE family transcriptional regulator [Candidatus Eisenbacteria bacterium]|jgi:ribosome-binding protein aMBF1 (putative translation factor)
MRTITDAVEIIDRLFFRGRPERQRGLEEARLNAAIAREIYALRTKAKLTQRQLAGMIGTTASVISRLEDADYEGHSLPMLQRISAALHRRVEVRFIPIAKGTRRKKVPA